MPKLTPLPPDLPIEKLPPGSAEGADAESWRQRGRYLGPGCVQKPRPNVEN